MQFENSYNGIGHTPNCVFFMMKGLASLDSNWWYALETQWSLHGFPYICREKAPTAPKFGNSAGIVRGKMFHWKIFRCNSVFHQHPRVLAWRTPKAGSACVKLDKKECTRVGSPTNISTKFRCVTQKKLCSWVVLSWIVPEKVISAIKLTS